MAQLAEVVTLYDANASNIVQMLRDSANTIGAETPEDNRTTAMVAVQVHEDGTIQVYGWGDTDTVHAIGTLHLGAARLMRDRLGEE